MKILSFYVREGKESHVSSQIYKLGFDEQGIFIAKYLHLQLIELQYSVLLAAAPALPSPFQGLTHSSARSRGHPIVAVVQCDWTTVCCFGDGLGDVPASITVLQV